MNNEHASAVTPDAAPTRQVRLRRNPKLIAIGLLLTALGGLLAAVLVNRYTDTERVVVMTDTVRRGDVITAGDVTTTSLGRGDGVGSVPADQLNSVIGTRALMDLPRGVLVVAGSYGQPDAAPGSDVVGVKLAAGRLPSAELVTGDSVIIVPVGDAASGEPVAAVVVSSQRARDSGDTLVDLSVGQAMAARVAQLAAVDQVALIKKGPPPAGASERPADPESSKGPADPGASERSAEPGASERPADPGASERPADPGASERPR